MSTIYRLNIDEIYSYITYSPNLTIEHINQIPLNILRKNTNTTNISRYANLYYKDIIENKQIKFNYEVFCRNNNILNNFSKEDCFNIFDYYKIKYDFYLLFSLNKEEYSLEELNKFEDYLFNSVQRHNSYRTILNYILIEI